MYPGDRVTYMNEPGVILKAKKTEGQMDYYMVKFDNGRTIITCKLGLRLIN